jgi:hypothetical protein
MPTDVEKLVRIRQKEARKACDVEAALFEARSLSPDERANRDRAREQIAHKLGIHAELLELKAVSRAREQRYRRQLARSGKSDISRGG